MAGKKRSVRRDEEAEAERLLDEILNCEPILTEEFMQQVEESFIPTDRDGATRRIGLAVTTKGGDWYRELATDQSAAETMIPVLGPLHEYVGRLRQVASWLEQAQMRMTVALCKHENLDPVTMKFREEVQ